jgi:hypothetical protein
LATFIYIISEQNEKNETKSDDEYWEEEYDLDKCFENLGEHDHVDAENVESKQDG